MSFVPGVTDVLDANGNSLIQRNPDGNVPTVQVQLGAGLVGSWSKNGAIGIIEVTPDPDAGVVASSIAFGSGYIARGGQYQGSMPGTGGTPVALAGGPWTVLPGGMLTLRSKVSVYATLPGVGVVWCYIDSTATFINAGAGVVVANGAFGAGSTPVPPFATVLNVAVSVNTVSASIMPLTVPAWSPKTYAGGILANPPNPAPNPSTAIMDPTKGCDIVSHSGLLYVCTAGGASTVAPTGTGGPITGADSVTWYEFGPASAGLAFTWTLHEIEVLAA